MLTQCCKQLGYSFPYMKEIANTGQHCSISKLICMACASICVLAEASSEDMKLKRFPNFCHEPICTVLLKFLTSATTIYIVSVRPHSLCLCQTPAEAHQDCVLGSHSASCSSVHCALMSFDVAPVLPDGLAARVKSPIRRFQNIFVCCLHQPFWCCLRLWEGCRSGIWGVAVLGAKVCALMSGEVCASRAQKPSAQALPARSVLLFVTSSSLHILFPMGCIKKVDRQDLERDTGPTGVQVCRP